MRVIAIIIVFLSTFAANAQTNKDAYEPQVRCGKQAADAYAKDYVPVQNTNEGQRLMDYENHYSSQLNKCFFLEKLTFVEKGKFAKQLKLFDLNENKEYGTCFDYYLDADRVPRFISCHVRDAQCSSEKEFRTLIKPYMED
jgi:hypothetical protein